MDHAVGDIDAFIAGHGEWILRLCYVLTPSGQDAEDAAQEVMVRVVKHWNRVSNADEPRAYLRRVIVNECMRLRRPTPTVAQSFEDRPGDGEASLVEDRDDVDRLLATLSNRQAAAVALRYLDDQTYSQIARVLRCREATARSLVKRGIDRLRTQFPEPVKNTLGEVR